MLQDWLTESARLISKCGHTVEWVTPLGLPVIQPYHRARCQAVSLTLTRFLWFSINQRELSLAGLGMYYDLQLYDVLRAQAISEVSTRVHTSM